MVSQCTAFRGCYQLVFELVRPSHGGGSVAAEVELNPQQLQQLQEVLELQIKQQLPVGWLVRSVQLVGQQQQEGAGLVGAAAAAGPGQAAQCVPAGPLSQPGQPAGAADSLAAALACLWSRDHEGDRAVMLQPLAVAMPTVAAAAAAAHGRQNSAGSSGSTGEPSTSGGSSGRQQGVGSRRESASAAIEAELLLPKGAVQHMLQQGHRQVRCVVALQPEGAVLLDQAWPLSQEPAAAAEGVRASADSAAATAAEQQDMRLQLKFTCDAAVQQGTGSSRQFRVLSVVVLAKDGKGKDKKPQEAAANASVSSSRSSKDGSLGFAEAAAVVSGAAVPGVIAHLPLLLLPGGAAAEMQGVVEAAVSFGMARTQANQQLLLRLVQDWALLVLLSDSSSSNNSSSGSSDSTIGRAMQPPLQHMQQSLYDSLSAYFMQHKMEQCRKLLGSLGGKAGAQLAQQTSSTTNSGSNVRQLVQAAAVSPGKQAQPQRPSWSVDFYLYTFKIAQCTAQHPHDW